MTTTINGRTPEEIKKGLECCKPKWEHDRWISCSDDCPFMNEGTFCRIKMQACVSALIQQLERERDAAIKDMAQTAVYLCCACKKYHHNDPGKDNHRCEMLEDSEGFERVIACDMFEWRGTQEEV